MRVRVKAEDGTVLTETVVYDHDEASNIIIIENKKQIDDNQIVNAMILSSPPITFKGRIFKTNRYYEIRLFKGESRENRISQRFNVNRKAAIVRYIDDGKYYKMLNNIAVKMVNISEHGLRIKGADTMLNDRDKVQITFLVNDTVRIYNVEVRNIARKEDKTAEYGCKFIAKQ